MNNLDKILKDRAKHFIDCFGHYTLTVIQKTRNGGNYFNEELFNKVEEILAKNNEQPR